jgi:hypothetical protein
VGLALRSRLISRASDERRTRPHFENRCKAQKERLLGRLKEGPGPHEREEIKRQLEEIDATFDFLDEAEAGEPARRRTIYSQGCLDPRLEMLAQCYRLEAELCLEMVSRAGSAVATAVMGDDAIAVI